MDIQRLKVMISIVESADNNIAHLENLRGRECALIPTDSDYYKAFIEWSKTNYHSRYDGAKNCAPVYYNVDPFIDYQIQKYNKNVEKERAIINDI